MSEQVASPKYGQCKLTERLEEVVLQEVTLGMMAVNAPPVVDHNVEDRE